MEFLISIGPEGTQKILVVSHERSGTHFLMNSIGLNFGYDAVNWIDLDMNFPTNFWNSKSFLELFGSMAGQPMLNIAKSHHPVEFFLPILREVLDEFLVFYIHRDGKEVMESCSRHFNQMNLEWDAGPNTKDGEEYAKAEPCGGMLRYQTTQFPTCFDRWEHHVKGWILDVPLALKHKIVYVEFSDLRDRFDRTMKMIAMRLGRPCPETLIKPSKFENVVTPNLQEFQEKEHML